MTSVAPGPPPPRRARWRVAAALLVAGLSPALAGGQVFETVGTRALGMGGAFVAVADDASANYWNPAGLGTLFFSAVAEGQRIQRRPGPETGALQASNDLSVLTSLATPSFGLSYYRLRSWQVAPLDGSAELLGAMTTQHLGATFVQPISPGLAVATVVKVVRGTFGAGLSDGVAPIDGLLDQAATLDTRTTNRFDLDIGIMAGSGPVRVGVVARNMREPEFAASDELTVVLKRHVRAGVALRPRESLLVALDADLSTIETFDGPRRMVAVGVEQRFARFAVRAGGRYDFERDNPAPVGAVGFSLEVTSGFWLDGQATRSRNDEERGWGVSARVGL